MSHSGHKIVKCSECDKIIMQCRCMDKDKPIEYRICEECFEEMKCIKESNLNGT